MQGRIQDFKLGGRQSKKLRRAEGGAKINGGISCEKSRLYAKKSHFFPLQTEAPNFWGISCEKSRFYAKTSYFFQF
jgi:hypothetical protein